MSKMSRVLHSKGMGGALQCDTESYSVINVKFACFLDLIWLNDVIVELIRINVQIKFQV